MALSPTPFTPLAVSQALDLSKLPPPDLVETISFEAIYTGLRDWLVSLHDTDPAAPDFSALLESDPAIKLLQIFAYRETIFRQRVNDAGMARMLAFAQNADLDQVAAFPYGVERLTITLANPLTGAPAVMEPDADLRRRCLLAIDARSVAGPEAAYIFRALSADASILDASATSPAPKEVVISVMSRTGTGEASAEQIAAVQSAVADDKAVRPLTDYVTVQSVTRVNYHIVIALTLFPGPDRDTILEASVAAVDAWKSANRRIGLDAVREAIIAAAQVPGVYKADLIAPAADVLVDMTQIAHPTTTEITVAGYAG